MGNTEKNSTGERVVLVLKEAATSQTTKTTDTGKKPHGQKS